MRLSFLPALCPGASGQSSSIAPSARLIAPGICGASNTGGAGEIGVAWAHWTFLLRGVILPLIDADLPQPVIIDWECEADDPSEDWTTPPTTPPTLVQPVTSEEGPDSAGDSEPDIH